MFFEVSQERLHVKRFPKLVCDTQPLGAIAILTVTSPIVINVPTRGLLAVETKDCFVLWLPKFKYQKNCL